MTNKKIAICYFGLTRSIKKVYKTHINLIFKVLESENIDYTIFMHTWKTGDDKQYVWGEISNTKIDYDEYKLLSPDKYKIELQDDFLETIKLEDYFDKKKLEEKGHHDKRKGEWLPELIRNHLCALESQKRCFEMVEDSKEEFDYVMVIRPDSLFCTPLNPHVFKQLDSSPNVLVIPSFDWGEGYNDRFAMLNYNSNTCKYLKRIEEIYDWRKNHTNRIVSEKYVKYICDKYYHRRRTDIYFKLIRP